MSTELAVGVVLAAGAAMAVFIVDRIIRLRKKEKSPSLEDKIASLTRSLRSSLAVISEIEGEIEKRSEIATKLKDDVERYKELRELNRPQVEAITQSIRAELEVESKKSLRRNTIIAFGIALGFFFLGSYVGPG